MTIKQTCSNLTTLLHKIRDSKKGDDSLVADAMALFATLSSQHTQVLNEAQLEYDKVYEVGVALSPMYH